jgi:uncharacterized protein DUF4886
VARRAFRLAACAVLGLVLGLALFVGLVGIGVVRGPGDPILGGDLALARGDRPGLRVLFVGNSYTAQNSLPALVHALAAEDASARPIFAVHYVAAGRRLAEASHDEALTGVIKAIPWDAVVLQEQSRIPSLSAVERRWELAPYAIDLDAKISSVGSRTVLFMTWGYRHGDRGGVPGDTFDAMQARLARGYWELGTELAASVAPVGLAWAEAVRRDPQLELWARDGKHASRVGSYLAACVLYEALSGRDPRASRFTGGLARAEARFLQDVAADVVGGTPSVAQ